MQWRWTSHNTHSFGDNREMKRKNRVIVHNKQLTMKAITKFVLLDHTNKYITALKMRQCTTLPSTILVSLVKFLQGKMKYRT